MEKQLSLEIRSKCEMYLLDADVPFIEELALKLEVNEAVLDKWGAEDIEFYSFLKRLKQTQKVLLLKHCSPEYLLSIKHGMVVEEQVTLKGKEEKGKIGIKVTPGSVIKIFLEKILQITNEKNTSSV